MSDDFREQVLEALRRLEAGLLEAKGEPDIRDAASTALDAAVGFIDTFDWLQQQNLSAPLIALRFALSDLHSGIVAPLVQPGARASDRPPRNTSRKLMQAWAVFGVDVLLESGTPLETACRTVADTLSKGRIQVQGKRLTVTWKVLKGWRDEAKRLPSDDQVHDTIKALRAEILPKMHGLTPAEAKPVVVNMILDGIHSVGRFGENKR